MGAPLIDGRYISFYRYHTKDPIYFSKDLKVTIQQIGYDGLPYPTDPDGPFAEYIKRGEYRKDNKPGGYFERVDDMCSTAYWYQTLPTQPFPAFPGKKVRTAKLAPEGTRVEAEGLSVKESIGGPVEVQEVFSGKQLWFRPGGPNARFTIELPVERSGKYSICAAYTRAADYGIFQMKLDGKLIVTSVDGYIPMAVQSAHTEPVVVDLAEGKHDLTFEAVGRNAASVGHLVGIDSIYLDLQ